MGAEPGEPLPGNTLKIVDPLTGAIVPRGERGEIAVKGPTLMLGYIGIPLDETLDEEGFFRTGDGGYIDERGRLFWEGRLNDIIKTGGANVSPVEVDGVLADHPGVKVSQTVGVPHETLGEMVVACVVPQRGRDARRGVRSASSSRASGQLQDAPARAVPPRGRSLAHGQRQGEDRASSASWPRSGSRPSPPRVSAGAGRRPCPRQVRCRPGSSS